MQIPNFTSQDVCRQSRNNRVWDDENKAASYVQVAADCDGPHQELFTHALELKGQLTSPRVLQEVLGGTLAAGVRDGALSQKFLEVADGVTYLDTPEEAQASRAECSLLSKSLQHTPPGPWRTALETGLKLALNAPSVGLARVVVSATLGAFQADNPLLELGANLLSHDQNGRCLNPTMGESESRRQMAVLAGDESSMGYLIGAGQGILANLPSPGAQDLLKQSQQASGPERLGVLSQGFQNLK